AGRAAAGIAVRPGPGRSHPARRGRRRGRRSRGPISRPRPTARTAGGRLLRARRPRAADARAALPRVRHRPAPALPCRRGGPRRLRRRHPSLRRPSPLRPGRAGAHRRPGPRGGLGRPRHDRQGRGPAPAFIAAGARPAHRGRSTGGGGGPPARPRAARGGGARRRRLTTASRYRLEARAAAAVAALASVLPLRVVRAFGRGLGRLLGDLDRRHVAVATANLRQAFPHWDEVRRLRTAREVYAHFGQVLLEILWLHGRSREQVLPLVELEGRDNVEAAFAAGRGVLCVTAHIGNWEMHGLTHGWMFGPISVVARPLDNPDL